MIAVTTGTRALDNDTAAETTARAIDTLCVAGIDRLYLKIDSTVRGSVAGQITGALRAWTGQDRRIASAVICPAFPEQHRTVYQGRVLVNGIPLEQTPTANDPVTPRSTGDLTTILPDARCGTSGQIGTVSRLILDAATDADLDHIAAALSASGPETVMVGSGGLAAALARRWSLTDPAPAPATAGAGKGAGRGQLPAPGHRGPARPPSQQPARQPGRRPDHEHCRDDVGPPARPLTSPTASRTQSPARATVPSSPSAVTELPRSWHGWRPTTSSSTAPSARAVPRDW